MTSSLPVRARFAWWAWAGIYLATLAAYFPALRGGLLWDDDAHVTRPELRSWAGLGRIWSEVGATQQYYPVLHSAFWLEHRLWGDATLGYHLANVLLHATAACLFVLVLRRLAVPGAWLAGLVFALHPVAVESVAWISEQKNTLSTVFYLLAAWALLDFGETRRSRSYCLGLGLFALALLSKSVTATLPAALLVVAWWRRGRLSWRDDVLPLLPCFLLGAASGLFTAWVERHLLGAEGADYALGFPARCLLAGRVAWFYLGKLLWPANLVFIYPRWEISATNPWLYLFPLAALAVLAALWRLRRRTRGPLAATLLFGGALFPALGFFNAYPFRYSFVADHFQYLASLGVIALAAAGWSRVGPRSLGRAVPVAVLLALGALTWRQCRMYRDLPTLYRTTIARNPGSWMAYGNLGTLLLASGQSTEAFADLNRAVELNPGFAEGQFNLANALRAQGRRREAIARYEEALRLQPAYPEAHDNLGTLLFGLGRAAEAIGHYRAALALRPNYPEAEVNLGVALQPTDAAAAIACYQRALQLAPGDFAAHFNLGIAWRSAGRLDESIREYEEALRLRPDSASALNNLGVALVDAGRRAEAIGRYQEALRLEPANAEIVNNRGIAEAESGRLAEAIADFEQALRLRPDYRAAHYNLSFALRDAGRPAEADEQSRLAAGRKP
jgi:tetratricopeptide (TPR) repeat protein